jgi:hypothetical protein
MRASCCLSRFIELGVASFLIRYKQLRGFYLDECDTFHIQLNVSDIRLTAMTEDPTGLAPVCS